MTSAPDAHPSPETDPYPGGCQCLAYKWAFNVWLLLFLGVICAGLLNYLGIFAKSLYPGL